MGDNGILGTCGEEFSAVAVEEVNFGGGGRLGLVCSMATLSSDFSSSIMFGTTTLFFDLGGFTGGASALLETGLNFI